MSDDQESRVVIGEIVEDDGNVDTQLDRAKLETRLAIHNRWTDALVIIVALASFAVCCHAVCG